MINDSPTLEAATRGYSDALSELLKTLRAAHAQFQTVTASGAALAEVLKGVGLELSRAAPTEGTEHALAMLSWVLRTGEDTKLLIDSAIATHAHVLPRLSILHNVAADLSSAVRAASTPAVEEELPTNERRAG